MSGFRYLFFAGAVLFAGCGKKETPPPTTQPAQPKIVGAENTATVRRAPIATGPRISGSLRAAKEARVRAEAGGVLEELNVELGDPVKKDQILGRIEEKAARSAVGSARAAMKALEEDLQVAKKQAERTDTLVKAGALAERDRETANSAYVAAQSRVAEGRARLAALVDQLDETVIRAPFAGVISERPVSLGDVVAPGAALLTVIDPSSMRLEASVPSEYLSQVSADHTVSFQVHGYPDRKFDGLITRVAPAADPVTRQIKVLAEIPNPGGELVSGLFADGRIAAEKREGLVVPFTALETEGEETRVVRVRDGKAEHVPVELGIRDENSEKVEIVRGVNEGDILLLGPLREIAAGVPVQISGEKET